MTREEKEETYMALFNGGAHKDSLRRIGLNLKLGEEIDHLQYFLHGGRIAIALFDNDNVLLKSSSFDYKSPQITTKVTSSPEANQSVAKEVDFSLLVKNSKTSATISGKFIFDEEIKAPENWIRDGPKEELGSDTPETILSKLKLSEAEIENVQITDGQQKKVEGFDVKGFVDQKVAFDQNGRQVGKFLRLGKYALIASYTKDNRMRHGEVKLYSDENGASPISSFSTLSSLKSLTALSYLGEYIMMASLTNNGTGSEVSMFVAYKGKISSKSVLIQKSLNFDSIDLIFKEEKDA